MNSAQIRTYSSKTTTSTGPVPKVVFSSRVISLSIRMFFQSYDESSVSQVISQADSRPFGFPSSIQLPDCLD